MKTKLAGARTARDVASAGCSSWIMPERAHLARGEEELQVRGATTCDFPRGRAVTRERRSAATRLLAQWHPPDNTGTSRGASVSGHQRRMCAGIGTLSRGRGLAHCSLPLESAVKPIICFENSASPLTYYIYRIHHSFSDVTVYQEEFQCGIQWENDKVSSGPNFYPSVDTQRYGYRWPTSRFYPERAYQIPGLVVTPLLGTSMVLRLIAREAPLMAGNNVAQGAIATNILSLIPPYTKASVWRRATSRSRQRGPNSPCVHRIIRSTGCRRHRRAPQEKGERWLTDTERRRTCLPAFRGGSTSTAGTRQRHRLRSKSGSCASS